MTQVDKLKAEGINGKDIRIGILDVGVDYRHPALGGCFGPDPACVVSYGYDFIGDRYDGSNPIPDPDPFESCNGHGTTIAGIIASKMNSFGFEGAAPGTKLGMYRISPCSGKIYSSDIVKAAFNRAYEDGSDIISASISSDSHWPEDSVAVTVQRIVEKGVPCLVAMGNNGGKGPASGLFGAVTPAFGHGVTGVGSVRNTNTPFVHSAASYRVDNEAESKVFGWQKPNVASPFFGNVTLPIWPGSRSIGDGCSPLPPDTPDLSPFIVLISAAGSCPVLAKLTNVGAKGTSHMMIYTQDELLVFHNCPF
jgi:subtilisin family serine protease